MKALPSSRQRIHATKMLSINPSLLFLVSTCRNILKKMVMVAWHRRQQMIKRVNLSLPINGCQAPPHQNRALSFPLEHPKNKKERFGPGEEYLSLEEESSYLESRVGTSGWKYINFVKRQPMLKPSF